MKSLMQLQVLIVLMFVLAANCYALDPNSKSDEERILEITAKTMSGNSTVNAAKLNELAKTKDPNHLIVSLQTLEEYNNGHIPGAVHLPVDLSDLSKSIKQLPKDKTIILVSSNGQEACKIGLILRQLGYDAKYARLGMNAYNRLYAGSGAYMGDIDGQISQETADLPAASPQMNYSKIADEELIIRNTEAYAKQLRPFNVSAYDLQGFDDAVLLSLQMPGDYAKGHIPGTINISGPDFLAGDNRLLTLPKDKKIIVTCYIGHYSSLGAMLLNQMGYEAYSLAWGLSGWNIGAMNADTRVPLTKGSGFEVEKAAGK